MKLEKLRELHGVMDNIAVLQHFVDSPPDSLSITMKGVDNQIGISNELDMKVRILLGVQIEKMEEKLRNAGIDMTPEKKPEQKPETPPQKVIDAKASEPGEKSEEPAVPEESAGADEEGSTE